MFIKGIACITGKDCDNYLYSINYIPDDVLIFENNYDPYNISIYNDKLIKIINKRHINELYTNTNFDIIKFIKYFIKNKLYNDIKTIIIRYPENNIDDDTFYKIIDILCYLNHKYNTNITFITNKNIDKINHVIKYYIYDNEKNILKNMK